MDSKGERTYKLEVSGVINKCLEHPTRLLFRRRMYEADVRGTKSH
jgi:hypothetical protein